AGVIAADRLVDAAMDHARRVDQRVVLAHEVAQELVRRAVAARPRAALHAVGVDDRRGAVDDAGVGVAIEDLDLSADAVGVGDVGLPGIFLLMAPESACIPIPSEATMLFAGFNVSEGKYSLFEAVAVGSAANVVGSWIAYAVGYYGRIELLEKHGKALHIKP